MRKQMGEHNHAIASNTDAVFSTFIGCTVKGVVHFYDGRAQTVLVFECGWGLVFCDTGAYYTIRPEDVQGHIRHTKQRLEATTKELSGILSLAGEE